MKSILVIVLFFFSITTNAQLIHVQGSKVLGLNLGYVKNGINISPELRVYKNGSISFKTSLNYEKIKLSVSNASVFFGDGEVIYSFFNINEKVFFGAKAGLLSGVEVISNEILRKTRNQIFIGEELGLTTEYFLSGRIMFNVDIDQRFFQFSQLGNASFIIKCGIHYNL